MLGTFGGALEARKIDASNGRLTADVRGEIENEEGVLVIRRIHVTFALKASEDARPTVDRVHGFSRINVRFIVASTQLFKLRPYIT